MLLRSENGMEWSSVIVPQVSHLNGICRVTDGLLALGDGGSILQSRSHLDPAEFRPWEMRTLGEGAVAFTADAAPAGTLTIQASDDLRSWATFQIITNWIGRGEIIDTNAGSHTFRAYRILNN